MDSSFRSYQASSSKFDCALFDIDGVLVDIRKSYNMAIKKTVDFMLCHATRSNRLNGLVTNNMILKFRQTGGFNNDTDTSYAITVGLLAIEGGLKNKTNTICNQSAVTKKQAREFLYSMIRNADESGIVSVEKYLSSCGFDIRRYKSILAYPAPVIQSILGRVFDEIFYGPELFRKRNGVEPKYYTGKPMIENDKLVVRKNTLEKMSRVFGRKLAIVSGRSWTAAEYSLKSLLTYFDLDASVFLEDEKREYAKPSTYALKKAMRTFDAKTAVYAGDSTEDLLMARRAEKETGGKITFLGIYGCSSEPTESARKLRKNGADAVIKSVNLLPAVI